MFIRGPHAVFSIGGRVHLRTGGGAKFTATGVRGLEFITDPGS